MNEPRIAPQQSVRRAVDVLFCFDAASPALTAAEVAERTGLNRTTAWRCLQTLATTGLVRELGDGRWSLAARTLGLAEAYGGQWGDLEAIAGAALVRLRDAVGETAALHLREGMARVVVRQVESRHELHRTYRELGQPIPLHAGAPSLAVLAALPEEEQAAYVELHVPPAEQAALREVLAAATARGFASTHGSRVSGVASVAAAVRDPGGVVVGAVNVTGPEERLPLSSTEEVAAHVVAATRWIERRLAGGPGEG